MTKKVKTMKYKMPEVTAPTDAIRAIQVAGSKPTRSSEENAFEVLAISCYEDAE